MDENLNIELIEKQIRSQEYTLHHDDFFERKDLEMEKAGNLERRNVQYNPLIRRKISIEMNELEPGITITNKMVDNGELSNKQKIERHNRRKSIRKKLINDIKEQDNENQLSEEQLNAMVNEQVNFMVNAELIHSARSKEYKKQMSQNLDIKELKNKEELNYRELKEFNMKRRFWFDDNVGDDRIEEFITNYKFDNSISGYFTQRYVRENYSKSLKKLNELKGIIEYLELYPETELKQSVTLEEIRSLVGYCEALFKDSMEMLGYEFTENSVTMEYSITPRQAKENRQNQEKIPAFIKQIINEINVRTNNESLEKELNDKFKQWNKSDYEQQLSEERRQLLKDVRDRSNVPVINLDYKNRMKLLVYYDAQIKYLTDEYNNVTDEKQSVRRVTIHEKISQITILMDRVNDECKVIYGLLENVHFKRPLTFEQKDYYTQRVKDDSVQREIVKELLKPYYDANEKKTESLAQEKLLDNAAKLCKRIRRDMKPAELMEIQQEIYEMNKALGEVNVLTLGPIDKFNVKKIRIMADKARAGALYIANRKYNLGSYINYNFNIFTKEEQNYIDTKKAEALRNSEITNTGKIIEQYALKKLAGLEYAYNSITAELMNNSEMREKIEKIYNKYTPKKVRKAAATGEQESEEINKIKTNHPEFDKKFGEILKLTDYKSHYEKKKAQLGDHSISDDEKKELELDMKYLEIVAKLGKSDYFLAGKSRQTNNGIKVVGDVIIRSLTGFNRNSEIAAMSEKDIFDMTYNMAAGFFQESDKKIDKSAYKAQNMAGVKTYKKILLSHYKKLYAKYGLEMMNLDESVLRYDELMADFDETQVHDKLRNDPDNFNLNDPEDRLLYEIIAYYRTFMANINTQLHNMKGSNTLYVAGESERMLYKGYVRDELNVHRAYLKEHEGELKINGNDK